MEKHGVRDMSKEQSKRLAGVLLHPTSFPSPYGIGDLGKKAYEFIDFLEQSGQHLWQTLPLTPTGFGDSPYQSFSAFAGQPLLISPEHLLEMGLLLEEELRDCPIGEADKVDYGTIIPWKNKVLRLAFTRFEGTEEFQTFCKAQAYWLDDYAIYMACKDMHGGKDWLSWEDKYRKPTISVKKKLQKLLPEEIQYYRFVQYVFYTEWTALKRYANEKEIAIIGDLPIFVSLDSADVWANQKLFQLDTKGYPLAVAGVPPDYFSETGQLWGNPLYDWKAHKREGYAWWIARVRHQLQLSDFVRIDHFRGFESYWSIPYGEKTAMNGKWVLGPGANFLEAIQKALGNELPIIAEDLGIITPEVEALRDQFHLAGMKILQFAFESLEESVYLPHQLKTTNCVCYTGTHDNNTTKGWYDGASEESKDKVRCYMNTDGTNIHWDFIRTCFGTIADYAIVPLQDVLGVGTEGRMNTPGVGENNWSWRYDKYALTEKLAQQLKNITRLYGR